MATLNYVQHHTTATAPTGVFSHNDWVRITTTGGTSTSADWYTVNWDTRHTDDPGQFWAPIVGKYLSREKLAAPGSLRTCLNSLTLIFEPQQRSSIKKMFASNNEAIKTIRGFRTKNDMEKRTFIMLLKHVYTEDINVTS